MQNTQVTFSMTRGFCTVEIYLGEEIIDSIDIHKFAKVIEAHDKILESKNSSNKKYYDLCFLWFGFSDKLSASYYNVVDPAKLEVLDSIKFTFLKPKS